MTLFARGQNAIGFVEYGYPYIPEKSKRGLAFLGYGQLIWQDDRMQVALKPELSSYKPDKKYRALNASIDISYSLKFTSLVSSHAAFITLESGYGKYIDKRWADDGGIQLTGGLEYSHINISGSRVILHLQWQDRSPELVLVKFGARINITK